MSGNFTTDYGKVVIDNNVIAKVAGLAALECFGIVGMAALSKSDGLVKLLTRNSLTKGVRVSVEDNTVSIDFHVIVTFGVSIAAVAENLIDNVTYQIESMTGFKIGRINIFVEGVRPID